MIVLMVFSVNSSAQHAWFKTENHKDELFLGWGWNRASFTNSDIHFTGDGYDFTLLDVKAKDRQTAFKAETYFGLKTMTIPQTNLRAGYFLNDHIAITGGVDHMKYVMTQNQTVEFEGEIGDTSYNSIITGNQIVLTENFLRFEHTDGLNYINAELEYHQGIFSSKPFLLNAYGGAGLGALLPKSNVTLMKYPRNDEFHLAGYGLSAKFGMELIFWRHFFIRFEYKTGFINMPDIVTRKASIDDRAAQHFFFAQRNGMFGFTLPLHKKVKPELPAETN
jgi:Outer membrane protein beta-barrel domain